MEITSDLVIRMQEAIRQGLAEHLAHVLQKAVDQEIISDSQRDQIITLGADST